MPKRVFWPAALIILGLVLLSANLGFMPREFWNLWPLLFIIVGLGGLLTSDREEWMHESKTATRSKSKASSKKAASKKKTTKRKK